MRIVTDSTADFTLEEAKKLNIDIVPLKVLFGQETYLDRYELTPEDFYDRLVNSEKLPTTSQPSPQEFLKYIDMAKKENDSLVIITLASDLSGTYQSAMIAKEMSEYDEVYVVDSETTTIAERLLVEKAIKLRDEGKDAKTIYKELEEAKKRIMVLAFVDTLEYLYKGGRLSKTTKVAGTLLKLKPIIGIVNGELGSFATARGTRKATEKIIELIEDYGGIDLDDALCVGYTGDETGMDKFIDVFEKEYGISIDKSYFIGPVIGTHAGPGGRAFAYFKK